MHSAPDKRLRACALDVPPTLMGPFLVSWFAGCPMRRGWCGLEGTMLQLKLVPVWCCFGAGFAHVAHLELPKPGCFNLAPGLQLCGFGHGACFGLPKRGLCVPLLAMRRNSHCPNAAVWCLFDIRIMTESLLRPYIPFGANLPLALMSQYSYKSYLGYAMDLAHH